MDEEINNENLLQPYRGTKDYFPEDMQKLNYIFSVWRKGCLTFGFEEYLSPLVEQRKLYQTKQASGDEIANQQLFWFMDSAGRELGIRPEMTPSVSRMIGQQISRLIKPVKWFSIANFMRNERPQKGRTREFFQLNADIFGLKSVEVDLELIALAIYIMRLFGATAEMFEIRVNNREWFNYWLTTVVGISKDFQAVSRVIDNFAKYNEEENEAKLVELGVNKEQVSQILDIQKLTISEVEKYQEQSSGASDLLSLLTMIEDRNLSSFVRFDPSLVRGFDYYTGTVFEQFDLTPGNNRSMFGGGRYDKLVGLYSGIDTPANGFAPGNVTTSLFLDSWNLWPEFKSSVTVLISVFNEDFRVKSWEITEKFREKQIATELYLPEGENISNQLKYAGKKQIPYVIIYGPEEEERNLVVLKNMQTGDQQKISLENAIEVIVKQND